MKKLFFLLLTIVILTSCTDRTNVSGTNISIISPRGAKSDKYFSRILIDNFYEMSFFQLNNNNNQADFSQLDSSDYSATGIEVFHQTNIKFDDIEGKLILARSTPEADVAQLLFKKNNSSYMISTLFQRENKKLQNEIINSYKTIEILDKSETNLSDFLAFEYDENSIFKLNNQSEKMLIQFSKNGIPNENLYGQSIILLSQLPYDNKLIKIEQIANNTISTFVNPSVTINEIIKNEKSSKDNNPIYDFHCTITRENKEYDILCYSIIHKNINLNFTAIINNKNDIKEAKEFIKSIKLK